MRSPHSITDSRDDPGITKDTGLVYQTDPIGFTETVLGIRCWPKMREIMEAVTAGHRKILVRSCNGAGKTTTIAALCNWKLSQFPESIVLTTASSWTQVRRTLWGEIRKQARTASLYGAKAVSDTSIRIDDKHYALGISPAMPENAQGFHAPNMLIAIDEATGVDREIFDALSGNATSDDTQIIMICNPINIHSYPFEAEQTGDWHLITISAFEHPNVVTGEEVISGAVTRRWIDDRLRSWSYEVEPGSSNSIFIPWTETWWKKTPIVTSRILGEWADNESEGFITMDLIERAADVQAMPGAKALGVDVSRGSADETVFAYFDGNTQLPFECIRETNLSRIADRIEHRYREGWELIAVDDTGLGGGVSDILEVRGIPVHAVSFAQRPGGFLRNRKQLQNARAEMYFVIEEELRSREIRLLDDRALHQELTAPRLVVSEHTQAYKLEEKDLVKRRLGRSPDRADATALARYALRLEAYRDTVYFM